MNAGNAPQASAPPRIIHVPEDWIIIAEVYELFSTELKSTYKANLDRVFWCDSYTEVGPPSYPAFKINYGSVIYSLHPNLRANDVASKIRKFKDQFPHFPYRVNVHEVEILQHPLL